jgi:outer membrane biosynthesis protein TonB
MEFIEGQDLGAMVEAEGPLPAERIANYMYQACDGLAHAHSRNMIHCDIKPSNLMVNRQGVVKILDMGMARLAGNGDGEDLTESQEERVLGTVDYLSPEQAMESPDLDARADIYSLGCTLYFLLTGRPPFPEGTLAQRLVKHQTEQPVPVGELRPDAPGDLVAICDRMMAKAPEERFQAVAEVAELLADWEPEEPEPEFGAVGVAPEPAAAIAGGSAGRAADDELEDETGPNLVRIVWATVAVLVTVGLVAGGVGYLAKSESAKRREAERRASSVFGEPQTGGNFRTPEEDADEDEFVWPQPKYVEPEAEDNPEAGGDAAASQGPAEKPADPPRESEQSQPEPKPPEAEKPPEKPPAGDTAESEPPKKEPPQKDSPEKKAQPKNEPPEKKPPKQPPKPAPKSALAGLPPAVDLPAVNTGDEAEPAALVKIAPPQDGQWSLRLAGGANATGDEGQFSLKHHAAEKGKKGAAPSWLVQYAEEPSAEKVDVARLYPQSGQLVFAWLPAADDAPANHLRNAMLEFTSGKQSHYLALTKPQTVEPLEIGLIRGTATTRLPWDWMPQPGTLELEILGLRGAYPKLDYKPGKIIRPDGSATIIVTGAKLPEIRFKVRFPVTSRYAKIDVDATFTLETPDGKRELPFRRAEVERLKRVRVPLMNQEVMLKKQLRKLKPDDKHRTALNHQLGLITKALEAAGALDALFQNVQDNTALRYRLVTSVERQPVVLIETK